MSDLAEVGDLQVDQDLAHARSTWRFQRFGWGLMALIALAALAGLFGDGPLAKAQASSPGLQLDYDRFARHGAATELRLQLHPTQAEARVWVERSFIEGHEIHGITPEPDRMTTAGDSLWLTFTVATPSRPMTILFDLQPIAMWQRHGSIGTEAGPSLEFTQFVYP